MNTFDGSKVRRDTTGRFVDKPYVEGDVDLAAGGVDIDRLFAEINNLSPNWSVRSRTVLPGTTTRRFLTSWAAA